MLEVKVERCAGIDVGKKFLAVCVLIGLASQKPVAEVRRFGTSVKELERLRAWLLENGCTEAVMESSAVATERLSAPISIIGSAANKPNRPGKSLTTCVPYSFNSRACLRARSRSDDELWIGPR